MTQVPVVLLPGLLGSRLVLGERSVWGTVRDFYFPLDGGAHLSVPPGATGWGPVTAAGPIERIPILPGLYAMPIYCDLIAHLTARGFRVFPFGYDFRRDTVSLVRALARFVEQVGQETGAGEVALVGHSHGGVLASYLARFGTADRLGCVGLPVEPEVPRTVRVRGVIAIGTAFRGALDNLRMMLEGYRPAPFGFDFGPPFHLLARSAVETLPAPGRVCFRTVSGHDAGVDIYDADAWVRHKMGIFAPAVHALLPVERIPGLAEVLVQGLARGRRLHAAFAEPLADDAPPHRVIGATRTPTRIAGLMLDARVPGVVPWSFAMRYFDGSPHFARGDGEVDAASLAGYAGAGTAPVHEVPGTHRALINQPETLAAVVQALGEI